MNLVIIIPILSFLMWGEEYEIGNYYQVVDAKIIHQEEEEEEEPLLEIYPDSDLYTVPENVPHDIELLLIRYAARYALPLDIVVRLSEVESNHGAQIQSHKPNWDGSIDIGVLALNSGYVDYFSNRYFEGDSEDFDPYNPEHNIQTGLAYLAHLNNLTGDISSAVTAYNCGYKSMKMGDIPSSTKRYVRAIVYNEPL